MTLTKWYFVFTFMILFINHNLSASEFKIAVRAHNGIDDAFIQWQSTVDFLNIQLTAHNFTLIPIVSLNEISQRVAMNEFDLILTNPSSFIEINKRSGVKALVTLNNKRANSALSHFGSVIFTHAKNTDILTIKDLKDKKLMAVSEQAFGGWRVAWLEMLIQGFDPYMKLEKLLFAKSRIHSEVVYAVRDQKVDAGVVRTDSLERMEDRGEIDMRYFRIINNKDIKGFPFFLSTPLYPEWVLAYSKSLPVDIIKKTRRILLSIYPETKAAREGIYMGWVEPRDYESVNLLMEKLNVGPYAKQ